MATSLQNTINNVRVTDKFWRRYMDVIRDEVIPYQWKALNDLIPDAEPSHAIENFKIAAGESDGEYYGMVFQDSDVAKWLEAVAYSLETDPNPELEKTADEVIELLGRAQQEDGYLNTYYTIKEPGKRWTNVRDNHELYCAGHLIEAAVAYYQSTGKRRMLDILCKYADHIADVFGKGENQIQGYPGHQEIELALVKLYDVTGNEKYLNLSKYFIDERGKQPLFFNIEKEQRNDDKPFWFNNNYAYHQSHLPVREQTKAVGHAVRATYMYTAMADLAAKTGDESLIKACKVLWENVTKKQMYITAGIGSSAFGESFTFDFDLPNNTAYTETCASIALVFWANRMLNLEKDAKYADVMERALYNGTISGMDLDGKKFFYVNPLEVFPHDCTRHDHSHVKPVRQKWFRCACCPPNLARLIASLGHYVYSQKDDELFVNLYVGNEANIKISGQNVNLVQTTNYPWDGSVTLSVTPESPAEFTIALRIPGWCRGASLKVNGKSLEIGSLISNGYLYVNREWQKEDLIELVLPMSIKRVHANPNVRVNSGKTALQRGPVVYCLEEADNGKNLTSILLPKESILQEKFNPNLLGGITTLTGKAKRIDDSLWNDNLYSVMENDSKETDITAIPYFAWCNREPGEMIVWIKEV